jgi:hypothetical protein
MIFNLLLSSLRSAAYRLLQDPGSFFRTGQAFAVLLPEQRVYKTSQKGIKSAKKTLYLSYQLPKAKVDKKGHILAQRDEWTSAIISQTDDNDDNESSGSQTTYESKTRSIYIGEAAIRRLVVVREGITSSLCL